MNQILEIDQESAQIREEFLRHKADTGASWTDLAAASGIATGTLSAWGTGNYDIKGEDKIAPRVKRYLASFVEQKTAQINRIRAPKSLILETTQIIHAALTHARMGEMVAIFGNPGVSKTESLNIFAKKHPNVWVITASPSISGMKVLLLETARAMGIMVDRGSSSTLSRIIRDHVSRAKNGLIIFDEAQNLTEQTVEEIRAIYDATGVGVAFFGNYETLVKIEGSSRSASHAQRFSRISMRLDLDEATQNDIAAMISGWGITEPKQIELLTNIASIPGGGALRTLTKTIALAKTLALGAGEEFSLHAIQSAYSQLGGKRLGGR